MITFKSKKAPLDIMTKSEKFWKDDTQVIGLAVFKRYSEPGEDAGMYISWIELEQ